MKIGVLQERQDEETRVAAVPNTVMKYVGLGFDVLVEKTAGLKAGFDDEAYLKAGAVLTERGEIFAVADLLLLIKAPDPSEYSFLKAGQIMIADFESEQYPERSADLAATGITALALEKMPRISRAQSMDILSSQNNLAGYKAALTGMNALNRGVPLMITSAGTIPAAKALVLGAGVAGLQAIATLKRMGAVVYASDVRAAAREQAESLGAHFLVVDDKADFEGDGGYASEITPEYLFKQKELISERLKSTDILITTALAAGKNAPVLVTAEMATAMPAHAVIVDMAGGNVENPRSRQDLVFVQNRHLAALVPDSASRLFARNVYNLIELYGGANFKLQFDDEILAAICLCFNGKLREKET